MEELLDLAGIDVLAAAYDHVLESTLMDEEAVRVHSDQVASSQEAIARVRLVRLGLLAPIAEHGVVAAH